MARGTSKGRSFPCDCITWPSLTAAPTAVHIPKDMIHGPLTYKRIDRPIVMIDSLLSAQYSMVGKPPPAMPGKS